MNKSKITNFCIKFCRICGGNIEEKILEEKERKICKRCGTINYENPIPAVAMVAKNKNGDILLIKRKVEPKKGFWALPSGFIEMYEDPEIAALREFKEETGFTGKIKRLIGIYSQKSSYYNHILVIAYFIEISAGHLSFGDDAEDAKFFKKSDLPKLAFSSHYKALKIKKEEEI